MQFELKFIEKNGQNRKNASKIQCLIDSFSQSEYTLCVRCFSETCAHLGGTKAILLPGLAAEWIDTPSFGKEQKGE